MPQLTVRGISEELIRALENRAAANGRSVEAEHREILEAALLGHRYFAIRARKLRERLKSRIDSSEVIRGDRDGRVGR